MQSKGKKIGIIIAACVGFIVVMGITIAALSYFNATKKNSSETTQQQASLVTSTVDMLSEEPLEALKGMNMLRLKADEVSVVAQPSDVSYTISVPAGAAVTFTSKDPSTVADIDTILAQSETKLESLGFVKQTETELRVSYRNATTLCQVDVQKDAIAVVSYACTDDAKTEQENKAINSLVTLYNSKVTEENKISSPSHIARTVLQRDAVTGATLSVQNVAKSDQKTGAVYLFGAIDGTWEYVADLSSGVSTGKTNVSEESMDAVNDPRWNGVLAELIGL